MAEMLAIWLAAGLVVYRLGELFDTGADERMPRTFPRFENDTPSCSLCRQRPCVCWNDDYHY